MINEKKHALLTFVWMTLLAFSTNLMAQEEKTINRGDQTWYQYYNSIRLSDQWSINSDVSYRVKDGFDDPDHHLFRTGLTYSMGKISFGAGISQFGFYNEGERILNEIRPHQEVNAKASYGAVNVKHRLRLEERFIETSDNVAGETQEWFRFRFRYMIMLKIPLAEFSSEKGKKKLSMNLGNEIFINAGKEVVTNIYDQNWLITGINYQINSKYTVSLNYNYIFAATATPDIYNQNDVIWFSFRQHIDLSK